MPGFYDTRGSGAYSQTTSTAASDVHTILAPKSATGCLLSVDTTDARVTFDGSTPTASAGHLVKFGQAYPWYVPLGSTILFCSTVSANSILSVTWLFN